jgi:amino acid adenylation domain-containing protein
MNGEQAKQRTAFSAEELELLAYLLHEEGVELESQQTIFPRQNATDIPLSFAQQRLWFLHQLEPTSAVYNLPLCIRLRGSLDVSALEGTINEIIKRHEALRTVFKMNNGGPVQSIAPRLTMTLPVRDLSELLPSERDALVHQLALEEARRPFDLVRGPLLRAGLLRLAGADHIALLTMHHIVSDGWSMEILVREVMELYQAFKAGIAPNLSPLPIQYADYALWQRQWLQGEVLEKQLSYWREQLADIPMLNLPTDRVRPVVQRFQGAQESRALAKDLSESLAALSRREGLTLFMLLLAAFKVLLYRYTRQEDVVVGTPVAGRNRLETEGLIGFFINTLVLRANLGADPTFREVLNRVRETVLAADEHQDIPFEKLVEELQPERDLSRQPLFQVVFVLQNALRQTLELPGLTLALQDVGGETAKFDLTLVIQDTEQGLIAIIEYNTDLFDKGTASRMLAHFETLLEGIVENPGCSISTLSLLTETERQGLLAQARMPESRTEFCLHELFESQAGRTPAEPALVYQKDQLTYDQLNRRANQMARHLRSLGVGPESLVAICIERSIEMPSWILAILKAGGAYVPLDPAYPRERLDYMLDDGRISVLLTDRGLYQPSPSYTGQVVDLDSLSEMLAGNSEENLASETMAENPAYVIYTSGSTGKPKGVLITHANVVRLFATTRVWFDFGPADVWTMFHSYAFDFSVWELWGALLYGGRLVIVPYKLSRSPEAFLELLCAEQVTVLNQTPSAFRQLMRAEESAAGNFELSLRQVIFGGEALELRSLQPWFDRHGDEQPGLINMYGITETTVHVTYRRLDRNDADAGSRSLIGGPIPDLDLYVLDDKLQLVPLGVAGEMCIGGAGLARGYLHRPGLTAERFIPNPFGDAGSRLYRSGDLGRRLPDGDIEYLGRLDHQVKIRGYRIETGEIETVLSEHDAVREAVVEARDGGAGDMRLVAYVGLKRETTGTELRSFLQKKLPDHMLPAAFVFMEEWPLTPNGKVDRKALPAPGQERPDLESAYVAPRTETEELLAAIWSEVLGVTAVGVHDNFFALGGDSILSVRLLGLAGERGVEFSLQQLFRHQTIHELAQEISIEQRPTAGESRTGPFSLVSEEDRLKLPAGLEDAYPLTMLQVGMFYHMDLMPDFPLYHNIDDWQLRAHFEQEIFQTAVQHVVQRHPVLRTSFDLTTYSEPLQLVHNSASLQVEVVDGRHLSTAEQDQLLDALVEREKKNRFDISRPPLLRFHVHLRTDDSFQFTLTESHTIFDGWSLTSTLAEIFEVYSLLLKGQVPPAAPTPSVTFREFVRLERSAMESEECRHYWAEVLDDCRITQVPRWPLSSASSPLTRVRSLPVPISRHLSEGLKQVAQLAKVPIKSVLLAAHLKALEVVSGQTDIITGLTCNGRPEETGGADVRGLFLNTVPFRLQLPEGTWLDLVRKTFEAEWELLPFRRYPLSAIQRKHGGQPLFEAAFNYVHFHGLDAMLQSGDIEVLEGGGRRSEETNFVLSTTFSLDLLTENVQLNLECNALELSETQTDAIAGYYANTLDALARDPFALHHADCLLSTTDQSRMLREWNDTRRDYRLDQCLHQLIEAQVESTPDVPALIFGDTQLTYRGLNQRANQMAHHLRSLGVGPESLVGVMLERSIDMVVALLGILKAGAAYLPLDPLTPAERLTTMLTDAAPRVLLTEEQLRERVPDNSGIHVLNVDRDRSLFAAAAEHNPESGASAANLAYVIYTSGSTGHPKAVMSTHGAICNRLLWMQEAYRLEVGERVLQKTPYGFDVSVWEFFWPLMFGATLVVARPGGHQDTAYLVGVIEKEQITTVHFVPSMLQLFLEEAEAGSCASLRRVICSGEALSWELQERFLKVMKAELYNLYGPTEAAVDVTSWRADRQDPDAREKGFVPIGRPIANTEIYLLNPHLQPVALGVPGELHIGGVGLGRGYLHHAALTAEKFIPHPFSTDPGARLYKTGDLARYSTDGGIEFLGRLDHQVKVRGFRIELGEIESVLEGHESIREAVVTANGEGADKQLVAYLVAAKESAPVIGEVRRHLRSKLPEHMVPSAFVVLQELPLTPNGKVDRKALPNPEKPHPELAATYLAPQTEVERIIAGVWQEVLQIEKVGIYDNFFDLGGDSLSMLRVHRKLREISQKDISMVEVFEFPTVHAIARHLIRAQKGQTDLQTGEERAEMRRRLGQQRQSKRQSRQPLS